MMDDLPDELREYRVRIIPIERAGPIPTETGRRTKFGGIPDGIQEGDDERKTCPQCYLPLHFIAQIDSFEQNSDTNPNSKPYDEQHYMFGDAGMIYVWYCFQCMQASASMSCY
jgi:hypothetical protein